MFDISSGSNHTSVSAEISPANFSTNTALTASIGNDFLHSSSSSSLLGTFANSLDSFSPALTSFENHHASKESNLMLLYPTTGEVPPSSNVHVFPQFLSKDNSITHPSSSNPLHVSNQVGYFNYDPTSASPIATSPHSLTIPYPIAPVYSSNSLTSPLSTSNIHTVSTSENYTKYCHELKESSPLPDFGIPTPSNLDCSCPNDESTHPRLKSRGLNLISKRSDSNPWSILQQGFNFCEVHLSFLFLFFSFLLIFFFFFFFLTLFTTMKMNMYEIGDKVRISHHEV
ncbi:hypothetical protein HMI56_004595 [Coelomomyces lativittatus]|nr:hypothetical protein HMI56_004595 [Coelomomyces lativittatus]